MDTFEAIRTRRAVKRFDPGHKMTPGEVRTLMELAILSPTSYNQQNWRFVTVTDQDVKERISVAARGQPQPTDCSLAVILCGNLNAWNQEPKRYWRNHSEEKQEMVAQKLRLKYQDSPRSMRDEAMRSCGFAAQTIMLAARQMGLDTCPMVGFEYDDLARIIELPDDHVIVMMIAVGRALEPAAPRGGQLSLDEVVFENRFQVP